MKNSNRIFFIPRVHFTGRLAFTFHLSKMLTTLGCVMALTLLSGCEKAVDTFDLVIKDAVVFDGMEYKEDRQDIFIRNNRIAQVIPSANVDTNSFSAEEFIDADGAFVMPGLIEGHGHLLSFGESLMHLELGRFENWDQIIEAVEEKAATVPEGTWIEGRGWHQEKWDETPENSVQGYPVHSRLSERVPNHPVYLQHASGHAGFANQNAMELVGISMETADPVGGRILKDQKGKPTGVFEENAVVPFESTIQSTKQLTEVWESALEQAGKACLENGITSFQDAGSSVDEILWFRKKAEREELPIRLYVMAFDTLQKMKANMDAIRMVGHADTMLTCRAVKTYFDGALGSRGAWLLDAYRDQPGYFGQNTMLKDELLQYAEVCMDNELQFCIHAIGDRANRATLDLFEEVAGAGSSLRWRIEHAQHIDPEDQSRFAELGVIASMQPIHCTSDAPYVVARLGEERARSGAYVWRNLLDRQAHIAVGTDVPVEPIDPFANMYAALTRKSDPDSEAFFPDQAFTRTEILHLYTVGNAYAAFEEDYKGQIESGYLADLVILDTDLMTCSQERIPETEVLYTILNGNVVYKPDAQ